ncbi:MAG: hypothetical protein DRJ46_00240 [Thermoprotei archaeon]|nr:MAG: hypothetical protein DRJ46_00240 [Thermoprotei archaeon]
MQVNKVALGALLLAAALLIACCAVNTYALSRGQLRIQLSYYGWRDGWLGWHPWNSTYLNLHGEDSHFTIAIYNDSNGRLVKVAKNVVPDTYGNITITDISFSPNEVNTYYTIKIWWNVTAYDGTKLSFLVFNATAKLQLHGTFGRQLTLVSGKVRPSVTITQPVVNWSRLKLAVYNITLKAIDSSDRYPLEGATIVIYNVTYGKPKTQWTVLYNVTTPSTGALQGVASFLLANTTNIDLMSWENKLYNYTVAVTVTWMDLPVYNATIHADSNRSANYPRWGGTYSPYNFSKFAGKLIVPLNCSVYKLNVYARTLQYATPVGTSGEVKVKVYLENATYGLLARSALLDAKGYAKLRYVSPRDLNLNITVGPEVYEANVLIQSARAKITVHWEALGIGLVIYNATLGGDKLFGTSTLWIRCYANRTLIQLFDKSGGLSETSNPLSPMYSEAELTIMTPYARSESIKLSLNGTGFIDLKGFSVANRLESAVLPLKDGTTKVTYHLRVYYKGVLVYDSDLDPSSSLFKKVLAYNSTGYAYAAIAKIQVNLYPVTVYLHDAHGTRLNGTAYLVLKHEDTGTTLNVTVIDGIFDDVLPGGTYKVSALYKTTTLLTPLETDTFSVPTTGTTTIKLPVYNVYLKATNWEETWYVEGINFSIKWPEPWGVQWANMSTERHSVSRKLEPLRYVKISQVPIGTHTVYAYVKHVGSSHGVTGLERYYDIIGTDIITVEDQDVYTSLKTWIYDPKIVFKTMDGEEIPRYSVVANTTFIIMNFTVSSSQPMGFYSTGGENYVKLYTNVTAGKVFVGGVTYNFTVYMGGVCVYGPYLELPKPTTSEECSVNVNVAKVTFHVTDWSGATDISGLKVSVSWSGINYTYFNKTATTGGKWVARFKKMNATIWGTWSVFRDVKSVYDTTVSPATRKYQLFNVTARTDAEGKATIYVPVWVYGKGPNHTPLEFNVTTVPGETPGIPSGFASRTVMDRHAKSPIYKSPWFYNVTESSTKDVKVYATTLTVKLRDYAERPLSDFTLNLTIKQWPYTLNASKKAHIVGTATSDDTGKATFKSGPTACYWTNYSYVIWAYKKPIADGYFPVEVYNLSRNWSVDQVVTLRFEGVAKVTAIDALSTPLEGQLVVARAATGVGAGEILASSFTDASGVAEMIFPEATTFYYYGRYDEATKSYVLDRTSKLYIDVYWTKEGQPYWDVLIGHYVGPYGDETITPSQHVLVSCKVFYAKFMLVSDTGRALEREALKPAEPIPVKVTFYLAGQPRPDIFSWEGYALDNATFKVDRCPIGDYRIEAWWPKTDIKIYDTITPIESNIPAPGAVETARKLKCLVYDITLVFRTPRGTTLDNATAYITLPQGVSMAASTDAEGKLTLINIPIGTLTLERVTWRGWDAIMAAKSFTVEATKTYDVVADNIVTLTVKVVGTRDQGLSMATVFIKSVEGVTLQTLTADESGVAVTELPRAKFVVEAIYKGKTASTTVDLTELAPTEFEKTVKLTLDVFVEIMGVPMSASELALWIVLSIILVLVIAFIIHEYIVWRRKRIAAAVVRA